MPIATGAQPVKPNVRVPMRRPRTITLLVAGVLFWLAASIFVIPTTMLRPIHGPGGEVVRRPDGRAMFERDTLRQIKHDWLPELMVAAAVGCFVWSATRGIRFLYDRVHNHAP